MAALEWHPRILLIRADKIKEMYSLSLQISRHTRSLGNAMFILLTAILPWIFLAIANQAAARTLFRMHWSFVMVYLTYSSTSVLNPDHWSCVSTVPEPFRLSNVLEVYYYIPQWFVHSIELYSPVHSCAPQNLAEAVDSQSWICNPCLIVNNEIRRGNIITPPSLSSIKTGLLHKALKSVVIGRNVVILNSLPVRNLKFRSIGFDLRR